MQWRNRSRSWMRFVPLKNSRDTCWVLTGYPALKMKLLCASQAAALGQGSLCNQAIMLITDGAMEDFQDVFEEFNWPERRVRRTNALTDVPLASTNQTAAFSPLRNYHCLSRSGCSLIWLEERWRLQRTLNGLPATTKVGIIHALKMQFTWPTWKLLWLLET